MDVLDHVAGPGRDLLGRVDAVLVAAGAPPEDPIWLPLRRVGALPGDALEFAVGLDAQGMTATSDELRLASREFADRRADLATDVDAAEWTGSGAEAFTAVWAALADHIGDGAAPDQPTLAGRLVAQASYLDSVARWVADLRAELAVTLATVLTSAEAVVLHGPQPATADAVRAASAIGTRVLSTVADALQTGYDLHDEWAPHLRELRYQPPADPGRTGPAGGTRVEI
jgi:hypothetical protein